MSAYPTVVAAVPSSQSQLDVEFSADMEDNEYLRDPELYALTGGLVARGVEVLSAKKVRLYVVPDMAADQLYAVQVYAADPTPNTYESETFGSGVYGR